jgi:hypothetical protein
MILNPYSLATEHPPSAKNPREFIPAWDAVFRTQKAEASDWLIIAQPDHAALAGTLAQGICSSAFPKLEEEAIRAISLHDEGWQSFDQSAMIRDGRPLSFLDLGPSEFLQAWTASISAAEQVGALAGILVSGHFLRLAQVHVETRGENAEVRKFLQEEFARQDRLLPQQNHTREELAVLTDVLQFCDLLSLYLCCGAPESIEFPQRFNGTTIRLYREGGMCRLESPMFGTGMSLGISARHFPPEGAEVTIPILLG